MGVQYVSLSFKLTAFVQGFVCNPSGTCAPLFSTVLPQLAHPPPHFRLNPNSKKTGISKRKYSIF